MGNIYDLSHRTVLVTGASSGIGAHLAQGIADKGATVVLAARRMERLKDLEQEILAKGGKAFAVEMDVTREASVIAGFDEAEQKAGVCNTVIANAGLLICEPALDLPIEDFDRVIDVNLRGAFLTAREGARRMIASGSAERQDGRILLTSSSSAEKVIPTNSAYGTAKSAIRHLAQVLALEWIRLGINVNAVLPGLIRTEMTGPMLTTAQGDAFLAALPRQREMEISALDDIVFLLCSDAAKTITGAEFLIDDGHHIAL